MAKIYDKNNVLFHNGYICTKKGKIICVDAEIVNQMNDLETKYQMALHLQAQPKATPMPTLKNFHRASLKDHTAKFSCATPVHDAEVEKAMILMDEIDMMAEVNNMNQILEEYNTLLQFTIDAEVIDKEDGTLVQFDTPMLGNPLKFTESDLVNVIAEMNGYKDDEQE